MITSATLGRIGPAIGNPGGQGGVFTLPDRPGMLLKKYHDWVTVNPDGLVALVEWMAGLPARSQRVLRRLTSWPTEVVDCGNGHWGILIRRADVRFFHRVEGEMIPRDLSWAFCADAANFAGLEPAAPHVAVTLVYQWACVLDVMHANGLAYGDLSAGNILWSGSRRPEILVLDCDSAHLLGSPRALADAQTPLWDCPWKGVDDIDRDRYKLALAFLRLYFRYQGPITKDVDQLDVPAQPAITRTVAELLAAGLHSRGPRPTAKEWLDPLSRLERGVRMRRAA